MSAMVLQVLLVSFCILISLSADFFFFVLVLALRVEKQKLSEGIEEMKITVHNSHNRVEEVITHAEEELALAKLIRRGADRILCRSKGLLKT